MKPFKYFPTRAEFREALGYVQSVIAYKVFDRRDREEIAANAISEAMRDYDPNNNEGVPFKNWARMKVRFAYSNWLRCRKKQLGIDRMTDVVESVTEQIAADRGDGQTVHLDQLEWRDFWESLIRALEAHEKGKDLARYWQARRQGYKPADIAKQMNRDIREVYNLGRQLKALIKKLLGEYDKDQEIYRSS